MTITRETEGRLPRGDGEYVAWKKIDGAGTPVVWLNGFRSDMGGTKVEALADWARREGRALVRFDYFAHGASTGDFLQASIGRWLQDVLAVLDALVEGEAVLVGSSMGGWLACLAAMARPSMLKALVLIAPAADFTDKLLEPSLGTRDSAALARDGVFYLPAFDGDPEGAPITRAMLNEGRSWSILPGPVAIDAPVRILQGMRDVSVPWTHALDLAQAISGDDVVFSLIKDGDHRLSRPQDIARMIATIEEVA